MYEYFDLIKRKARYPKIKKPFNGKPTQTSEFQLIRALWQISIGIEIEIAADRGKEAGELKTNAVPPLDSLQADPKKHRFIADRRE
ncbi:hypothetical protein BOTCAL_0171g00040 [Botryotinia calthae]|uniref:Uncharacterized protein n=1 Tax=Botryotinia calthae TaxID=38488 RepID=A0A4Y8D102_9HELO|nr:hypothetical protein BOTCAL_0171g00040 [Botryotinia calthae]